MKRKQFCAIALLLTLLLCQSAQAVSNCKMRRKVDKDFVVQIKRDKPVADSWLKGAVLIGDSITRSLSNYKVLSTIKILSRIGQSPAGAMNNKIYRVNNKGVTMADKALTYKPKKLLIMLGSNGLDHIKREVVEKQYHELVDYFLEKLPKAEIYLLAVLPVAPNATERYPKMTMDTIRAFNKELLEIATTHGIHYVDIFTPLLSEDGKRIKVGYCAGDGMHLTQKGAQAVADAIRMQVGEDAMKKETKTK